MYGKNLNKINVKFFPSQSSLKFGFLAKKSIFNFF